MKITMQRILAVNTLFEKLNKEKYPIKIAYQISKIADLIGKEVAFYNQKLQEIIDTYAEKDENGTYVLTDDKQGIKVRENDLKTCEKKINELANLEVELETDNKKLKLDDLIGANIELTLQEVSLLAPFMEE